MRIEHHKSSPIDLKPMELLKGHFNVKRILPKMVQTYIDWAEKLPPMGIQYILLEQERSVLFSV